MLAKKELGVVMVSLEKIALPAGLYIVATPIGNLKDITLRALEVLNSCNRVVCEDTRVTGKLLAHYSIKASMSVYNDHSAEKDRIRILRWIEEGEAVVLVSDAGTPLISDPGYKLVRAARAAGLHITTLPGASALPAALTLSALPTDEVYFGGFLPSKSNARINALKALQSLTATLVFYERGSRVAGALADAHSVFGTCDVAIVREISKQFEEAINLTTDALDGLIEPRGEVVLAIKPRGQVWDDATLSAQLAQHLATLRTRDAVDAVVGETGAPKKHVYQLALALKDNA